MANAWVEIPLGGKDGIGRVALVSIEDYARVSSHNWSAREDPRNGYITITSTIQGKTVLLWRFIMGDPPFERAEVDHEKGNTLDNRRHRLRWVTRSQNNQNQASRSRKGLYASPYKGVQRNVSGRYRLVISQTFDTEEEAAREYDRLARGLWGPYARLNFPDAA